MRQKSNFWGIGLRKSPYPDWEAPRRFDRNLIVIGAGAAGLVASNIAATLRAKVTLIERGSMGGDCLNTGCVPSKALLRSARLVAEARRAKEWGIESAVLQMDFAQVMQRVQKVVATIAPHDSRARYEGLGVEVLEGQAELLSPWAVRVVLGEGRVIQRTARSIILATGAEPRVPDIPGLQDTDFFTSETIWNLRECPKRLLVLGGGPIGCELAQALQRLGSQVTLLERGPRLLPREDPEFSGFLLDCLQEEGLVCRTQVRALAIHRDPGTGRRLMVIDGPQGQEKIPFDTLLISVGRKPRLEGLGLENLGLEWHGSVPEVNQYLQSRYPNLLVCGDALGRYSFTHVAAHTAWFATVNALLGGFWRLPVDYSVIPWATFTDPEIARVGLSEQDAKQQGLRYEVTVFGLEALDRAIADGAARGSIKVLTPPGKDRILGVTIMGTHASEMLAEFVLAMRHGLGLSQILRTIHLYPTFSEANRYVAGEWRKAHKPERVLRWLERFHTWRRNGLAPGWKK